ncbi:hypothetical protein Tdes44962_MAKER08342 [Teratosphaeria destructans]|uniref:BTB domain-containing protein n=1 Tax=Teratosphaeria destructans TaxID=418781 RepID=A0A9W7W517_9PEZI|nr:hypothetical protein Tdes44962_MAKER08342 [Teratosphaeria destructans]
MEVMKQGLIKLFNEKKLTDFTITCGPHTFEVHKAILCAQSAYFAALPNFAEGTTNSISLKSVSDDEDSDDSCDDPEAIKLMIHYFYHHDYRAKNVFDAPSAASVLANPPRNIGKAGFKHPASRMPKNSAAAQDFAQADTTDGNMVMHARVFAAACKYHVSSLQTASALKFLSAVTANWDHHSFAEAARIVFSTTPEDVMTLRTTIVDTINDHPDLLSKKEVKTVVKAEQGLMYSMICKNYGVQDPDVKAAGKQGSAGPELGCADCGARLRQLSPCWSCGREYASCCTALCPWNCHMINYMED